VENVSASDFYGWRDAYVGWPDGRFGPARRRGRPRWRVPWWRRRVLRALVFGRRSARLLFGAGHRSWVLWRARLLRRRWAELLWWRRLLSWPLLRRPRVLLRRTLLGSSLLWLRNRYPVGLGLLFKLRMRFL